MAPCVIDSLDLRDLDRIRALQDSVVADLAATNSSHFIVPRDVDYFRECLSAPHAMRGVRLNDYLMAQAIHRFYGEDDRAPIRQDYARRLPRMAMPVSVLQGALVHPRHRGAGIMKNLVADWIEQARARGAQALFARVATTHDASRYVFRQFGFDVIDTLIDARDDAHVDVLYRLGSDPL